MRRTVVGKRIHKPKTSKFRRVDMSDEVMRTLEDLRRRRQEKMLAAGQNEIPEWVFRNREGKPPTWRTSRNAPSIKKAKLRRIMFHDLRHTFASLLIQNGELLAYVKDQLGHTSKDHSRLLWPLGTRCEQAGRESIADTSSSERDTSDEDENRRVTHAFPSIPIQSFHTGST